MVEQRTFAESCAPERFLAPLGMTTELIFWEANHALMYHGTLISTMLRLPLTKSSAFSTSARWLCSG
jgi:hypothetical protein